ncbi:ABC transporter permease [Paenibacillus assamensis]|uniref:ABC transporter permease n=1 Tax=Paenibacillus assamensis TaxID=311244 RepID=UPI0003FF9C6B|nr:ABC transporter permease [Paenibacillus assamensis]
MDYTKKMYISLVKQFTIRDIGSRYKNSFLGLFWAFLSPLFMLAIYSFVFTEVFQSRWGTEISNKIDFALILFCGLIVYQVFSESVSKAPTLITQNPNYVKKVVFPLTILPIVSVLTSLFHCLIGFIILFVFMFIFGYQFHLSILLLPVLILPLILFTIGVNYLLASLGVFVRDIAYTVAVVLNALFFMTPIFYPITAVPEKFQSIMYFNPLTAIIESIRGIIFSGKIANPTALLTVSFISVIIFFVSRLFFVRTRRYFNDVI